MERREFSKGTTYRVVETFTKFSEKFQEGQELELVDEGYSRYDGLRIFVFRDTVNGKQISLEITDTEDAKDWRAMFEESNIR